MILTRPEQWEKAEVVAKDDPRFRPDKILVHRIITPTDAGKEAEAKVSKPEPITLDRIEGVINELGIKLQRAQKLFKVAEVTIAELGEGPEAQGILAVIGRELEKIEGGR